jgi:hypothetical protein
MTRPFGNDRILLMHGPHRGIGVSRAGRARFADEPAVASQAVEVFAKSAEQALAQRLIAQLAATARGGDWMLQLNVDHGGDEVAALDGSACALVVGGTEPLEPALLSALERHSERGGAIVALNLSGHSSREWDMFCRDVLMVQLDDLTPMSCRMSRKPELRIAAGRQFHPVVHGVAAWAIEGSCAEAIACGSDAILEGVSSDQKRLLAWTIDGIWRRAFGTLLGSRHDIEQPAFLRLVWNAVRWTMP